MANLLISYPNIPSKDYKWIQSIRKDNDQKYFNLVKPHITLVFGTNKLNVKELLAHAKEKLHDFKKFDILLDSATVVEDDSKGFFHTFLVPSQGYKEINKCHDLLYSGDMSSELREDIPFIPHVGIGTGNEADMKELAAKLNSQKVHIEGFVDELTLVQFDGTKVTDLEKFSLL